MSDLVMDLGGRAATRYTATDDEWSLDGGRHAFDEDAVLTPIFHALTRGGWRRRQEALTPHTPVRAADPVDAFQRDPLTAPIPVQQPLASVPSPSRRRPAVGAHAVPEARPEMTDHGRHHRLREPVRSSSRW